MHLLEQLKVLSLREEFRKAWVVGDVFQDDLKALRKTRNLIKPFITIVLMAVHN